MNKNVLGFIIVVLLMAAGVYAAGAFYMVDETEQVVITQFGKPIGKPITKAGLYFKSMSFLQTVNRFEKRILQWDGDSKPIPTLEKQAIILDTTARWRIKDALQFMKSVRFERLAQTRLDGIIEDATKGAISNAYLVEAVRNSNDIIVRADERKKKGVQEIGASDLRKITVGREEITRRILKRASPLVESLGIELIDVRIKRINYAENVRRSVFERMISERQQAAEHYRSEGLGRQAEIEGRIAKELEQIRSEAYRQSQEIRGKADAKSIKIYADAYNNDPEFYAFLKTLETYRNTIDKNTTLMLSTDSELFQYLENSSSQ